ncbi:MAG: OmpA family protein [Roseovarius sp.]
MPGPNAFSEAFAPCRAPLLGALAGLVLLALPAPAQQAELPVLELPEGATLTRVVQEPAARYRVPTGPWREGVLPAIPAEGRLLQRAWRIDAPEMSTDMLQAALRGQLEDAGFEILFDCAARACGGFDFRFETRVMPAPDMFVDLMDFRFLSARAPSADGGVSYLTSLVSRAGTSLYVQVVAIGAQAPEGLVPERTQPAQGTAEESAEAPPEPTYDNGTIARALLETGHVILPDLVFDSGSATLAEGEYASLVALAAFLKAEPSRRVALVGHTDAVGGLEDNVALSRRRAASVLERLATRHEVPRAQMESNGMGYLSPVAPNTTQAGREANRRVEAVYLSLE